ncbi:sphingomyelin phosphodiesterase 2 isoform X2 [Monodelphis domestica]|nr:sphingomyelin phosphodiesterase 2 isoform X2 [Monodelphis domestica]XP_007484487.1 sphingomyelin phosphodiesterase 2 isoform X2 [Monodelphis domestica]XP_056674638.1 sphingomyelin phosphodiesterase 2 isoform X2 [Monodelphis domestica]
MESESGSSVSLKVFNLNCWAIPYMSKHQQVRMQHLGDLLNQKNFDLALLQEVWSERDFESLRQKLLPNYTWAHYFRSGFIGSGLCVFSKHPIQEIFQHTFSLNGYPYKLHHGDWFCGKAVGMVVLEICGILVNVYVTHLHAEYNREHDSYLAHRVAQAWELAQFIHHTSRRADVVLLSGDLNSHPGDVGYRLIKEWIGLDDSYLETQDFQGCEDGCTMVPNNCFVNSKEMESFPRGVRIDYILFKAISGFHITCDALTTTTGSGPNDTTGSGPNDTTGHGLPLSDHEALMATLSIRPAPIEHNRNFTRDPEAQASLMDVLHEAWTEMGLGLAVARQWVYSTGHLLSLGLLLLFLGVGTMLFEDIPWVAEAFFMVLGVIVLVGSGAMYLTSLHESKALYEAQAEIELAMEMAKEAQPEDADLYASPPLIRTSVRFKVKQ